MLDILMHICCAPDATVGYERLSAFGNVVGFFFNPNIEPLSEYRIREMEARRLTALLDLEYMEITPDRQGWQDAVIKYAAEPERGKRCRKCIEFNLTNVASQAAEKEIGQIATTLTASPHKDVEFIHEIGHKIADRFGLKYLDETLRKRDGYARGLELSRKYGIYRQQYCGCRWSLANYCEQNDLALSNTGIN